MSILSKLQSLLSAANTATGESDTTITDAMQTLIDGYGQGGETLRTTHYHGTLHYENSPVYNMVIPVTTALSTDIIIATFKITKTGTFSNGAVTWDSDLTIPASMNASSKRLTMCGNAAYNIPTTTIKYATDGTETLQYVFYSRCRQIYNKNNGNDSFLTLTIQNGTSIKLTPTGYNGKLCDTGLATEYEYDVYIMTSDGNALSVN